MLVDLGLQLITHCLGITQKHGGVVLVEHWVVCTGVTSAHSALHHNHRLALPDLQRQPCNLVWEKQKTTLVGITFMRRYYTGLLNEAQTYLAACFWFVLATWVLQMSI